MSQKRITEIVSFVGNGITQPLRCRLNDDRIVIFKTFNNPEGNRVLANEYICYHIAKLLNIHIPEAGVAIFNKETMISTEIQDKFDKELQHYYGLGYFSTNRDKVTQLTCPLVLSTQSNNNDISKIIMFDHLICNKDRNPGNLLIDIKKGDKFMSIIDHTHVFSHGAIWDYNILQRLILEQDYTDNDVMLRNAYIYDMFKEFRALNIEDLLSICADFKNQLTDKALYDIIESVPQIWGIHNREIQIIYDYIMYRLNALDKIALLISSEGGK